MRRPRDRDDGYRRWNKRAMIGAGRSHDRSRRRGRRIGHGVMIRYWKHASVYVVARSASLGAMHRWRG